MFFASTRALENTTKGMEIISKREAGTEDSCNVCLNSGVWLQEM